MRKVNRFVRMWSTYLFKLSFNHSKMICEKRVQEILRVTKEKLPIHHKLILKEYLAYLREELNKNTIIVEYADSIEHTLTQKIKVKMNSYYNKKMFLIKKRNPSLLAGICIKVGDDMWDLSIDSNIQKISKKLNIYN